ncbi:MAG: bifunctional folylpolyglutamate synthase/dihydrofolate synthase, partial [Paramuribaculum sp.]|nr:bifunctional folylpolyglutamate synthase/dihydrofolate synthase [Paramuribaculum sp.]
MTYSEATEFLYTQLPVFQNIGAGAYKPGLNTAKKLCNAFGDPQKRFRSIHVAGTNGKGSTSHTVAAVLQSAGYKVGLYTSPHLVDFRERIRVDGAMIPEADVVDFVHRYQDMHIDCSPSFFELTMTMAFEYFAKSCVDIAVIEVGLGGRLDSTNIITPCLGIITNISLEHTQFLGDTVESIAKEKAGIMKPGIPIIIGEASDSNVRKVFENSANTVGCPIIFTEDTLWNKNIYRNNDNRFQIDSTPWGKIEFELGGDCQQRNFATILTAINKLKELGFNITDNAVIKGCANITNLTGLQGRWQIIGHAPLVVCDTGHNLGGWQWLAPQIALLPGTKYMVIGFAEDKDINGILRLIKLIPNIEIIFTQASVHRAMKVKNLKQIAAHQGLDGSVCHDVSSAYKQALRNASPQDSIFIGGSSF